MLKVDLGLLERRGRITIDEDVPPDHPLWEGTEIRLHGPLAVRLEAQRVGSDVLVVLVRGRLRCEAELECRRCLERVLVAVEEPVSLLFRAGSDPIEAEGEEVYPLPTRARELELGDPVREQMLLAVPKFAICRESCRGLCPRCGAERNAGECGCEAAEPDDRWAALRALKQD